MFVTFRKLRLLMSKYGFSILFMGFELWASFAAFFWLNKWFPHWLSVAVIGLLYVTTILAIVNRNTPPENKVTWLLIAVIPVFGSLLYLMFERTAPVQKRNGPAEKYGINEVSRRQQQTITRGTQAREQGSLWYGQIHSIHGPQCRSL